MAEKQELLLMNNILVAQLEQIMKRKQMLLFRTPDLIGSHVIMNT